ncbi:MAG TPA: hypothetical protein VIR03_00955 [Candidatus Saccharimonadales bacterium]
MTRFLSLALGAQQPLFGQSIEELERAGGRPAADIRLSSELMQKARTKIIELGLDPNDTTGPELYHALQVRLGDDDTKVRVALGIAPGAPSNDVLGSVQKFLARHQATKTCFALKMTTAKRLLKKKLPKNAMKRLGYRSADSMLKHESVAAIYAAAVIAEGPAWHKAFREQYAKLEASDFEQRPMSVIFPKSKRWEQFAEAFVAGAKHNILCFKELGAVVYLPLEARVDGLAITSLLLTLHYANDIRTYSSFAKLQQVKPTFGRAVQETATDEPMTGAELASQPVPWKVIQRYYGRMKADFHPEVFEPHVQPDDLQWHDAESVLARLEPALGFWEDTQYVCMLHGDEPVSFNILDVALGYCNHLSFADRIVHFAREHLWHELMSRYLHQENLEAAVHQQLSRNLVGSQALAEL